jgi:hypothetical protein
MEINFINDISKKDLLEKVARLAQNSALHHLVFTRDTDGDNFVSCELVNKISKMRRI